MSLTVKNTQRVSFVLNLLPSTKVEGTEYEKTPFSMELTLEPKAGRDAGTRLVEKHLPASITWLPGETKDGLPEGLLEIDEFQRARNARRLVLVASGDAPDALPREPGEPKRYDDDATSNPSGEKA